MTDTFMDNFNFNKAEVDTCLNCTKPKCTGTCEKFIGGYALKGYSLKGKKVLCVETGKIYNSIRAAAEDNGIRCPTALSAVLHNRARSANELHFKFA